MEFSVTRYKSSCKIYPGIQYIEYTVLIEMMQIVHRGTNGKRVFRRDKEDDQPGRYLQHNPEKTNNGIHLKVE